MGHDDESMSFLAPSTIMGDRSRIDGLGNATSAETSAMAAGFNGPVRGTMYVCTIRNTPTALGNK